MRTIKFRAWYKSKMYNPALVGGTQVPQVFNQNYDLVNLCGHLEKYYVMQYTGLKDCKGKEIYEGDVALGKFNLDDVEEYIYNGLSEKEKKEQERIFVIEDIFYPYTNPIPEDLEVIGNVHENPELLKNK